MVAIAMAIPIPAFMYPSRPVPVRHLQPTYASWTTRGSDVASSVCGDEPPTVVALPKRRFALEASMNPQGLLKLLHKLTGHAEPLPTELGKIDASGALVRVLGWREGKTRTGKAHLVYTVLAAAPSRLAGEAELKLPPSQLSEARLVHRRYRDFAKLHAALSPRARQAGLVLPALPSKLSAFGRQLSPEVGAQRQRLLHEWLSWVAGQPALVCDELRVFLGLPPHSRVVLPSARDDDDMIAEPATPETATRCSSSSMDDEEEERETHRVAVSLSSLDAVPVNLAELERKAIEAMLDDGLWGRPGPPPCA